MRQRLATLLALAIGGAILLAAFVFALLQSSL